MRPRQSPNEVSPYQEQYYVPGSTQSSMVTLSVPQQRNWIEDLWSKVCDDYQEPVTALVMGLGMGWHRYLTTCTAAQPRTFILDQI